MNVFLDINENNVEELTKVAELHKISLPFFLKVCVKFSDEFQKFILNPSLEKAVAGDLSVERRKKLKYLHEKEFKAMTDFAEVVKFMRDNFETFENYQQQKTLYESNIEFVKVEVEGAAAMQIKNYKYDIRAEDDLEQLRLNENFHENEGILLESLRAVTKELEELSCEYGGELQPYPLSEEVLEFINAFVQSCDGE